MVGNGNDDDSNDDNDHDDDDDSKSKNKAIHQVLLACPTNLQRLPKQQCNFHGRMRAAAATQMVVNVWECLAMIPNKSSTARGTKSLDTTATSGHYNDVDTSKEQM